jgi:predicted transcriptional regulator
MLLSFGILSPRCLERKEMTVDQLLKKASLYQVAKILGLTPPAVYKWKKTGKIPELRLYQLKQSKPEWFNEQGK